MTTWVIDAFLFVAIVFNLANGVRYLVRYSRDTKRMDKVLKEVTESPGYECARLGHDLELDVETLDNQQPPVFVFTHLFKWSCTRCGYEQVRTMRQHVLAPEVQHFDSGWLTPVPPTLEDNDG